MQRENPKREIGKSRMKKTDALWAAAFFVLVFDRALKIAFLKNWQSRTIELIDNFFSLSFTANSNISFSLPARGIILENVIGAILIILAALFLREVKAGREAKAFFFFLVFIGGASNLFARIRRGFVVDYLEVKCFTAFHLADVLIIVGVAGLIFSLLRPTKK